MSYSVSNSRNNLLLVSLNKFFKNESNVNIILPIVSGNSRLSLRIIDWFVTNYSKKHNISYFINSTKKSILNDNEKYLPGECSQFIVYINYKLQLKGYSKKQFDPFCRLHGSPGISFYYNDKESFDTTIGQLNFFKWVISNKIIDYISANIDVIEKDMNTCYQKQYKSIDNEKKKKIKTRRKRKELSISASKSLTKSNVKVLVSFD
tara:strand:- start:344 stop:961 length:618 start_codon:yes stop_codon:yes gene_type:complete